MEKYRFAFEKFVEFENFLEWGHAPECLQEELADFARYFKNEDWVDSKAAYDKFSNGAYVGEKKNGSRNGVGMYVYDNGDLYIGEWRNGEKDGYGFYFYSSQDGLYWGQWENGERNGKGHMWSRNYESEGHYSNDKEINNMYVRNNNRYSSGSNKSEGEGGCLYYIILGIIILVVLGLIF